jgi:putative FmdB family regulatory protein
MPTYEYRCPKGHTFELFQRMSDAPPEACEVCGASPVERVLYPVAVHFKGSGFYSTDYGRGGKKKDAKDGDASSTDGKKAEKTSEKSTEKTSTSADKGSSSSDKGSSSSDKGSGSSD